MAIDLNPFDEGGLFGSGEDEQAKRITEDMRRRWLDLAEQSRDIPLDLEYGYGKDVNPYMYGPLLGAEKEYMLDPLQAMAFGLAPTSAATNTTSAYDALGPSAYEGMGPSAYEGMGPSAYGNLAFDPNRMVEAQDYFASVTQDPVDDIAEAEYARRQRQAEQTRRSHADAALRAAEAKGQGAYGDAILAELMGTQAMAGDMYQAGLDANATAQARRDAGATSLGNISERIARGELDADTARALGLDRYASERAAGLDQYAGERAAGLDAYGTNVAAGQDAFTTDKSSALDDWYNQRYADYYGMQERNVDRMQDAAQQNWNRYNSTSDANTQLQNTTNQWNKIGAPQQQYNWLSGAYSGAQGGTNSAAAAQQNSAGSTVWDAFGAIMPMVKYGTEAYTKMSGGK